MAHQTHQPKFKASQGYCLDCGADHSGFTCDQFCTMRAKALREQAAHASTTAATPAFQRFTKQAVTVDAYRLPLHDQPVPATFDQWCDAVGFDEFSSDRDEGLIIHTLEGDMRADPGDWIIKGVKGEFYPCKHDIFIATYAPEQIAAEPQTGATVQGYRTLTKANTDRMNVFKSASRNLVDEIDTLKREIKERMTGAEMQSAEQREADEAALRWLSIARTHAQQATMAACRAIAQPSDDC